MTTLDVGSVWQTDISVKWATPSMQGNVYIIGFFDRRSKQVFLYFSTRKDAYGQTKDLLEADIPKFRLRYGSLIVRKAGGEI